MEERTRKKKIKNKGKKICIKKLTKENIYNKTICIINSE